MTDEFVEKISPFEREIIFSMLDGNYPVLEELKSKVDDIIVLNRKIEMCRYAIEISFLDVKERSGNASSFSIDDQCIQIYESENILLAELTVIKGVPRYFHIGGKYDFEKEMTVKELFWSYPDPETGRRLKYVYSAEERNFDLAIGYIPSYK